MSIQDAHAFMKHLRRHPVLRKRIEAFRGASAIRDMAEAAAAEGFTFTEEEYRQAVVELSDGELSTESLDQLLDDIGLGG